MSSVAYNQATQQRREVTPHPQSSHAQQQEESEEIGVSYAYRKTYQVAPDQISQLNLKLIRDAESFQLGDSLSPQWKALPYRIALAGHSQT